MRARTLVALACVASASVGQAFHLGGDKSPFLGALKQSSKLQDRRRRHSALVQRIRFEDAQATKQLPREDAERNAESFSPLDVPSVSGMGNPALSLKEPGQEADQLREAFWKAGLVVMAFIWASNFPIIRLSEGGNGGAGLAPSLFCAARFSVAAAALLPFLLNAPVGALAGGAECGIYIALGYLGQAIGLMSTTANKGAFICSLQVVWVTLVNSVLHRHLPLSAVASALFSVVGVGLLELEGNSFAGLSTGDLWCLAQPVFFGTSYIRLAAVAGKYPQHANAIAAAQVLVVALISLAWAQFDGHLTTSEISPMFEDQGMVASVMWTGLISTAATIVLQTEAFKRVSAGDAAVLISTEPFWAALLSVVLLGEHMRPQDWVGGSFILAACLVSEMELDMEELRAALGWYPADEAGESVEGGKEGEEETEKSLLPQGLKRLKEKLSQSSS